MSVRVVNVCVVGEKNGIECGGDTLYNGQRWVKLLNSVWEKEQEAVCRKKVWCMWYE